MPCAVGDMHLRLLLFNGARVDALPLTFQNIPGEADRLSIASPCPSLNYPAGDAECTLRAMRVDAGLPRARGGSAGGCGHDFASLGRWGAGGR